MLDGSGESGLILSTSTCSGSVVGFQTILLMGNIRKSRLASRFLLMISIFGDCSCLNFGILKFLIFQLLMGKLS